MNDAAHPFVTPDRCYLLSHSVGLPVAGARDAAGECFEVWEHSPAEAWPRWLEAVEGFRSALASLLNTDTALICPQSNVSSGLTKLLGAVKRRFVSPPRVLISEDAFPSLGYVCQRSGYDVVYLPREMDVADPSVWSKACNQRGIDVAIVTHVHSNTGVAAPVDRIADVLHAVGTHCVVDVAQSVGVVPIDMEHWAKWGVDAVVGSCVKWLSGGPGAGWLWLSPEWLKMSEPTDVGWWSHEAPFEFDIHSFRDAPDALRFWGGTPTVMPFAVAAHSIRAIESLGVRAIRQHNVAMVDALIDALGDRVVSPHDRDIRSGTAIVAADAEMVEVLAAHDIDVDHRAHGIRVSPHVHTTAADIDRLIDIVTNNTP